MTPEQEIEKETKIRHDDEGNFFKEGCGYLCMQEELESALKVLWQALIQAKTQLAAQKKESQIHLTELQVIGALARGYCTPENRNKILDNALIMAMTEEVMLLAAQGGKVENKDEFHAVILDEIGQWIVKKGDAKTVQEEDYADAALTVLQTIREKYIHTQ